MTVQVAAQLRAAMREGRLTAGERLPSSRRLAAALGVSRTVVTEAYEQLYAEGWLVGRHGSGTYVADVLAVPAGDPPAPPPAEPAGEMIDLRPGEPWTGDLDTPAWRRAWRAAAVLAPAAEPDPHGLPGLRAALTERMRRGRGVTCPVERVMVTRGAGNGLDLLAATVLRPGDRVGVEDPGYPRARTVLAARGLRVVPCPVDEQGLVVDGLPDDLRLIYTTPSHQYPLGGVLPVPRRQSLLAWARRTGALVAEDDYDGEFRYGGAPLPALYGLDPEVVVYLGTSAKILTPAMGVGWLVARPDLVAAIAARRPELGDRTAVVPQEALRVLLDRGDLDRYLRRMRAEYARRRAVVVGALAGLRVRGDTAGLHLVVELPAPVADRVVRAAGARGVRLDTLSRHHAGSADPVHGLVIGYGAARRSELRAACALVRELVLR
ncbi:PLP-dependent aminotransferase family protein [Actinomadura craniellae]|uniref:PLP-dependent aminotransferase family protein n=2 Tax=Actinomadura craniellae TaxID=2231787 RepID=A0A365GYR5_9ACTN|nr:PLP-dependent aminotransferase family protein [Actinomadura craniellae]